MINRDTIFISHSTPQDNTFSIWIASRLEMLGYKVWVDKDGLLGGERFWTTIQKAIDQSVKILFVYSKNIVDSEGVLKQGIEKEIEYGYSIAAAHKLKDFIIPLHIDESQYHLVIGMPNINHIQFSGNWAEGLKQLLRKLEKDGVPKMNDNIKSSFSEWYVNEYSSKTTIESKKRLYYSTWWGFKRLPDKFYIFRFETAEQAKFVCNINPNIPLNLNSNLIVSFEPNLILSKSDEDGSNDIEINPKDTFVCTIDDLYSSEDQKTLFPSNNDKVNAFKRLMMSVWKKLFFTKGFYKYTLSGKRFAFYIPNKFKTSIQFYYPYSNKTRKKKKTLHGTYKSHFWHFALSGNFLVEPFICYQVKSHIIFTSDGRNPLLDERKMHSFRRDKGKNFFNEEWRDLFLAVIQSMKDEEGIITINVDYNNNYIEFKEWPETFWSDFDYCDPMKKMDFDSIMDSSEINEETVIYDN